MISYREKQLLTVMKMLQDESADLSKKLQQSFTSTLNGLEMVDIYDSKNYRASSFDELVARAEALEYDMYIRASDVLTKEEIADIDKRRKDIDNKFNSLVKLHKGDYGFLFSAVLLLLVKQLLIKFEFSDKELSADETDKAFREKYDHSEKIDGKENARPYYAPKQQILYSKTVPFDIVQNTKYYNHGNIETGLGLNGNNHRFKSVGHDPTLGLVFGTANIITNTATFFQGERNLHSYHIMYEDMSFYKKPYVYKDAGTILALRKTIDRCIKEPRAFGCAFLKECLHIKSDKNSIMGIPLPFLMCIFDDETVMKFTVECMDWASIADVKVISEQAAFSVLINMIISYLHRLYILWNEVKEQESLNDAIKTYINTETNQFDKIRTKKIIMYANAIASTINLGVCVGGGIVAYLEEETELATEFFEHIDLGGLIVTLTHLFKDGKYIAKVKNDFIKATIEQDFQEKLKAIEMI